MKSSLRDREIVVSHLVKTKNLSVWLISLIICLFLFLFVVLFDDLSVYSKNVLGFNIPKLVYDITVNLLTSIIMLLVIGIYYEKYVRDENLLMYNAQLFNPHVIFNYLNSETVENVGKAALSKIFDDDEFGSDILTSLKDRVRRTNERWYDYTSDQKLQIPSSEELAKDFFEVIIQTSHKRKIVGTTFDFVMVDNVEDWERLMLGKSVEISYLFRRSGIKTNVKLSKEIFEVISFYIDDVEFKAVESVQENERRDHIFGWRVELPKELKKNFIDGELHTIRYVYRAIIRRRGHVITQGPSVPTKNISLSLDYRNTDIAWMGTFPFFTSSNSPILRDIPRDNPAVKSVSIDGWVLPRSGAVWVWSLEEEVK